MRAAVLQNMSIIHISVNYSAAKNIQYSKQGGPRDLLCFCVFVFVMLMQDLLLHEDKIICFHGNNGSIGQKKNTASTEEEDTTMRHL